MDRKQIADYLWNKAPSHLKDNQQKEEKDSYKLFEIWSGRGYEVREAQKQLRQNRFPQLASNEALYLIAKERAIEKFDFETVEEFRQRVINALDWHSLKGTVKGIKTILEIYGFKNVKITPVLKTDPNRWTEFRVETTSERQINAETAQLVIDIVNKLKPTHEKLREIILSYLSKAQVSISSGTMAETTATADMITGFEWNSSGTAFVYTGTMAEVSATTQFVEV